MNNLLKLFQRTITIGVVIIACHSQLFAQSESITALLGASKESFIKTCQEQNWKYITNEKGSMNFDFPGGNWFVSFNKANVVDLINLTIFGKEQGEDMMQQVTSGALRVADNATVTRWRRGSSCLMYFKMFQPTQGTSILISDDFFNITSVSVTSQVPGN